MFIIYLFNVQFNKLEFFFVLSEEQKNREILGQRQEFNFLSMINTFCLKPGLEFIIPLNSQLFTKRNQFVLKTFLIQKSSQKNQGGVTKSKWRLFQKRIEILFSIFPMFFQDGVETRTATCRVGTADHVSARCTVSVSGFPSPSSRYAVP